jgi:hypothetical protein
VSRLLVYGRTAYAEPLEELGSLAERADVPAAFPGDWVELVVLPEAEIHWIVRDGKEVESERGFVRARV